MSFTYHNWGQGQGALPKEVNKMGYVGKEEILEEIESTPSNVFSVLTDLNLAHAWGETKIGSIRFPQERSMRLGHDVELQPKGIKEPVKLKVRVIRYGQMLDHEVVEGPFFGNMVTEVEERPYGTLLTVTLNYRIERMGFKLKWIMSERKKYREMMMEVLKNIKQFSESRNS